MPDSLEAGVAETAKVNVGALPSVRPLAPRPVPAQVATYVQAMTFIGELTAGGYRKELHSLQEIIKHSLEILV